MLKALDKWFLGYLASVLRRPRRSSRPRHLIVAVCDHFEPFRDGTDTATARQTVCDWLTAYPAAVAGFRDADGLPPRHTFFYPQEEYDPAILDDLAVFCRQGFGEVEIHLHHRHDTPEGLREKLVSFRDLLHERHGLLGTEKSEDYRLQTLRRQGYGGQATDHRPQTLDHRKEFTTKDTKDTKEEGGAQTTDHGLQTQLRPAVGTAPWQADVAPALCRRVGDPAPQQSGAATDMASPPSPRYAFIHGNWSLCNSRPDGDWCGVNEELGILADTGCYADFTFPSAPSPTQPRMVNAIYYAQDIPGQPRGADRGSRLSVISNRLSGVGEPLGGQAPRCYAEEFEGRAAPRCARTGLEEPPRSQIGATPEGLVAPRCARKELEEPPRSQIGATPDGLVAPRCARTGLEESPRSQIGATPDGLVAPRCARTDLGATDLRSPVSGLRSNVSPASRLLLITGPLALNWWRRKWGLLPRLENADLSGANPPTADRVRLWARQGIGVAGRPDWVFVKLHTHGCVPANAKVLLGPAIRAMHETLNREFNDGQRWCLHYVTAREMVNMVKAAEAGESGAPGQYRDYRISPPPGVR